MNRKLIRADLGEIKEQLHSRLTTPKIYRQRKPTPPEQTNAENFYYLKQMTNRTCMVIVLRDGEQIRGTIEWYDRMAIKVNRPDAPNILLMKDTIKYMYKEKEDRAADEDESSKIRTPRARVGSRRQGGGGREFGGRRER
jgi:sRNA-binding regulator protein Hfq